MSEETTTTESTSVPETTETPAVDTVTEGTETEAPVKQETEAVKEEPKPDPVHNKLAALSRRENAAWRKEKELKELEAELKTRQEEKSATKEEYQKDPMRLMNDYGLTYEKLIDAAIGAPTKEEAPEVAELRTKLNAIEAREEQRKEAQELDYKKQQAKAYADDLKTYVDATEGKYELIKGTENYQLVLDTIIQKYQTDGEEVTWDTAADWVETYLEEEVTTNLTKLLGVDKIRKLLELDKNVETQETDEKPTVSDKTTEDTETLSEIEDEELKEIIERTKRETKQSFTMTNREMSSGSKVKDGKLTTEQRLERAKALAEQM